MLISKFDLYKTEWLELVFDNRNKAYGAYELRQHNSRTMLAAMGIAIVGISVPLIIIGALFKPVVTAVPPLFKVIPVRTFVVEHPHIAPPHQPRTHITPPPAQTAPANTPRLYVPVANPPITVQPNTRTDPAPTDLGSINPGIDGGVKGGTGKDPNTTSAPSGGEGTSEPFNTVEKMPEPYGGSAAWSKFLNKNLKYPNTAIDERIQGKVWVSFIVEKDGHLSNIVVEHGPGFGTNEEAIRVLKMAPAWKPGIQNGQPVRVRYELPINFQISDDNN